MVECDCHERCVVGRLREVLAGDFDTISVANDAQVARSVAVLEREGLEPELVAGRRLELRRCRLTVIPLHGQRAVPGSR